MSASLFVHSSCLETGEYSPGSKIKMNNIVQLSVEELGNFLNERIPDIDYNTLENFKRHKIDGPTFTLLDDEYLKELCPLLGDRIKVKNLFNIERKRSSTITTVSMTSTPPASGSNTPEYDMSPGTPEVSFLLI